MNRMIRLGTLAASLLFASTAMCASLGDVVAFEPDPVSVPADLSTDQATKGVVRAFVMRSWRVTEVNRAEGYIDAEYPIRVHVARVRARLADGHVTFRYRDSEKIEHGWSVKRTDKAHPGRQQFLSNNETESWSALADSPQGPESTLMVHPKYLEWVQNVSRTLEGAFRLETMRSE